MTACLVLLILSGGSVSLDPVLGESRGPGPERALDRGVRALADSRFEEALSALLRAETEGPYSRADYIRLHEQLGIVYAYMDRPRDATRAFDKLLALDSGHMLPYTLSPKVTFVFERARKESDARVPPTLDVSWPRGLEVTQVVPITVEVVADPKHFLSRALLYHRVKGEAAYRRPIAIELEEPGYQEIRLSPLVRRPTQAETIQLHLVVQDPAGNEVLQVADAEHPKEIVLGFTPPTPWYRRWWVWAAVGGVVAAGTGIGVYLYQQELHPPETIAGSAEWRR
jgi:hypothetical protein